MLRIDINSSRELQATVLALRQADKKIQANVRKYTKNLLLPEWQKGLAEHAQTRMEHKVLVDTGRVSMSNQNVTLKSGGLQKKLSGGARASEIYAPVEFGTDREHRSTYTATSRKGRNYSVNRRTRRQFRPLNGGKGYVVYPTAKALIPRFASLWIQTTIRTFHEALEGR